MLTRTLALHDVADVEALTQNVVRASRF